MLNYIPNIGSLIATILRVSFAFFQFGTFWAPFWIFIITDGLDLVLGNIIEPRIMGKGLGLSPLLVFFSLLFWGWLWGIPGMILSVPLTARGSSGSPPERPRAPADRGPRRVLSGKEGAQVSSRSSASMTNASSDSFLIFRP